MHDQFTRSCREIVFYARAHVAIVSFLLALSFVSGGEMNQDDQEMQTFLGNIPARFIMVPCYVATFFCGFIIVMHALGVASFAISKIEGSNDQMRRMWFNNARQRVIIHAFMMMLAVYCAPIVGFRFSHLFDYINGKTVSPINHYWLTFYLAWLVVGLDARLTYIMMRKNAMQVFWMEHQT